MAIPSPNNDITATATTPVVCATRPFIASNLRASDFPERPSRVAELLDLVGRHAGAIENRDHEVRERRVALVVQVLIALQSAAASEQQFRQLIGIVGVAVAHVAAEQNDRVVEQVA